MNIKSLLLGSAAALVAVSGARAADAVVIAEPEPMEYVRVCDTYGVGFYYIPGTETCIKVSGYIRYDIGIGASGFEDVYDKEGLTTDEGFPTPEGGFDDADLNDTYFKRARFALRVDARSETELGTLRAYAQVNFNYDSYDNYSFISTDTTYASGYNVTGFTSTGDYVGIEHAYIELGGFRVGKTDSLFSTFTGYAGGVMGDDLISYGPFGTHQIAYTFNGGNGFSAAIALEEGYGLLYTLDSYVPHVTGGVGYTAGWGGISGVVGYDANHETWAGKIRGDFNATDALSLFLMFGLKDDDDVPNFYGQWSGDWAVWGGGTWKFNEKTAANVQVSYTDFEDFAFVANVAYELVPNFTITPEVRYTDNFDLDDSDEWGGYLRMQANFGG
jgi:hypothetical protein